MDGWYPFISLSVGINQPLWYCLAGTSGECGFLVSTQLVVWYDGSLPSPSVCNKRSMGVELLSHYTQVGRTLILLHLLFDSDTLSV